MEILDIVLWSARFKAGDLRRTLVAKLVGVIAGTGHGKARGGEESLDGFHRAGIRSSNLMTETKCVTW